MVPPDNRCCFCLTLRTGTIFIALSNCFLYIAFFLWYLTSDSFGDSLSDGFTFTNLDISVFVIFLVQLVVNLLLLVGAVRKIPSHVFPWISANAVFCAICMISIVVTIFWGTTKLGLNHNEYITVLVILGLITGINLFCVIVVFQFRHNSMVEERIARDSGSTSGPGGGCSSEPPLPPPSYEEIERMDDCKLPIEDGPPEYEAAVAMLPSIDKKEQHQDMTGAVLRKKSLPSNIV